MKFKTLTLIFIGGLAVSGVSGATTMKIEGFIGNAPGVIALIRTSPEIGSAILPVQFMPEVYVGNGTRPGALNIEEESDSSDDASEDVSSKQSNS